MDARPQPDAAHSEPLPTDLEMFVRLSIIAFPKRMNIWERDEIVKEGGVEGMGEGADSVHTNMSLSELCCSNKKKSTMN